MTRATNHFTGVMTVAVVVADQERAAAFYVDTIGFEKRMDVPMPGGQRWIEVAPPGADTTLALVAATSERTAGADTGIRLATDDASADHLHLRAVGVDVDPEVLRWPGVPPMFSWRDCEGNTLYAVERPTVR